MPDLTNPLAERVRAVRALAGRPARRRHGQFLAEGPQAAREAVRGDLFEVRDLYVTPDAAARYAEIVDAARRRGVRTHRGSPEVLGAMSPDAQGVLAVVHDRPAGLEQVLADGPRLVAVLAQVRDPGNAGAVIRAADAAGADAVVLAGASVDVHNPKVVRSTAGSLFHLPVVTGVSLDHVTAALRAAGLLVLAADGSGDHDLDDLLDVVRRPGGTTGTRGAGGAEGAGGTEGTDDTTSSAVDLARPTAWVLGNEAWGLPETDRALADAVVRVPIHGRAESLNLATAATVCLYASARAHR